MPDLMHWLTKCNVCPHGCGINRIKGQTGFCRTKANIVISSANLHFGEEPVLVGRGGSGTIFFTACNLKCVFCQNYDISQLDYGRVISPHDLLNIMLNLQSGGAENINLVTPTHQAPQIFETLKTARKKGLNLPVVYNCGGYENPEFLKQLDGLVDIYMPDFKYGNAENAQQYSGIKDYTHYCKLSLLEMHRQVGDLFINSHKVAESGLLIRHLVLPDDISNSERVIDFIAEKISPNTYLNIMDQYRPCFKADDYKHLRKRVLGQRIHSLVDYAHKKGMHRILY